jgi:hypothetical protein
MDQQLYGLTAADRTALRRTIGTVNASGRGQAPRPKRRRAPGGGASAGGGEAAGLVIGFCTNEINAAEVVGEFERGPGLVSVDHHIVGSSATMLNFSLYNVTPGTVCVGFVSEGDCYLIATFC